ncbi:hypothetical protein BKA70DRAFT_1221944 [Coprinopsis sp. MPI-PUGE-AT-0042]|nr:hypothetical protein BKA70DRAFT_1221944 [Coprinopsis sp. MPI-PUGE-AT-0042]
MWPLSQLGHAGSKFAKSLRVPANTKRAQAGSKIIEKTKKEHRENTAPSPTLANPMRPEGQLNDLKANKKRIDLTSLKGNATLNQATVFDHRTVVSGYSVHPQVFLVINAAYVKKSLDVVSLKKYYSRSLTSLYIRGTKKLRKVSFSVPMTPLPLELISLIIEDLSAMIAAPELLSSTRLVCQAFNDIALPFLFRDITLGSALPATSPYTKRIKGFLDIACKNATILHCIESIHISWTLRQHESFSLPAREVGEMFRYLRSGKHLRTLTISRPWGASPVYARDLLAHINIIAPTIEVLHLLGVRNIPSHFFTDFKHLKKVSLREITFADTSNATPEFLPLVQELTYVSSASKGYVQPILDFFDFSKLSSITSITTYFDSAETILCHIRDGYHSIQTLSIDISNVQVNLPSRAVFRLPVLRTLVLHAFDCHPFHTNPFPGAASFLQVLDAPQLQMVTINAEFIGFMDEEIYEMAWDLVDSELHGKSSDPSTKMFGFLWSALGTNSIRSPVLATQASLREFIWHEWLSVAPQNPLENGENECEHYHFFGASWTSSICYRKHAIVLGPTQKKRLPGFGMRLMYTGKEKGKGVW